MDPTLGPGLTPSHLFLFSLLNSQSQTHLLHLFPKHTCQYPGHMTSCVYSYSTVLFVVPILKDVQGTVSMVSAADGAGGDVAISSCLMQRHTHLGPKYGKEGAKWLLCPTLPAL